MHDTTCGMGHVQTYLSHRTGKAEGENVEQDDRVSLDEGGDRHNLPRHHHSNTEVDSREDIDGVHHVIRSYGQVAQLLLHSP